MDQVELSLGSPKTGKDGTLLVRIARELAAPLIPCVNVLFEKFECVARTLEEDVRPAHRNYMRRQLHPLVLCAPFAHRTYEKPLGYAGDYEMVNMMLRNVPDGGSLYARLVNAWFLQQAPAEAHRNRIQYLKNVLVRETARVVREGRVARVLNLGCGPAMEVQEFLKESSLSDHAHFTLLDFNEPTLEYTRRALGGIKRDFGRRTGLHIVKKSVLQVLKEAARQNGAGSSGKYDLIYCAGLFDYLMDRACQQIMDIFYDWLAPGGLVLSTNVEPSNPMRNGMEHLLDWNLIYRTGPDLLRLKPKLAAADDAVVLADVTAVNVMLEVRKPRHV
jgi:extracellular factor (EF) 3-hydroxypalmitic acid methyl ester biosynthesis protein